MNDDRKSRYTHYIGIVCLAVFISFWVLPWHALFAQGTPHSNAVSWTLSNAAGVTSQKLYRGTVAGGTKTVIATLSATATSFDDTDVTAGATHCYAATAFVGPSESVFSNETCVVDKGTNVNPQTGLAVISK